MTPCVPRATRLNPIDDPTMLCVPEIGSFMNVATSSQSALLASADKQPSINSISEPEYIDTSRIPFRIVSDTLYPAEEAKGSCGPGSEEELSTDHLPMSIAPVISQNVASQQAARMERTPEPTLVPNEFATSLAPIPNARINAMMNPKITIKSSSEMSDSIPILFDFPSLSHAPNTTRSKQKKSEKNATFFHL